MHRVELKAPTGAGKSVASYRFLMHRVELKVKDLNSFFNLWTRFLMHRVELKDGEEDIPLQDFSCS